jgi:hypothetical protein
VADFFQSRQNGDFFQKSTENGDFFRKSTEEGDFFRDNEHDFFFFEQQGPDSFFFNQEKSGEHFFESDAPNAAGSGHFFKRADRSDGSFFFFFNGQFFSNESAGRLFKGEAPTPDFFFFVEGSDSHTGEEPFFSGEFF